MNSASAPGKIILFGEHAVVYGRPALAVPVTQVRATVEVWPSEYRGIWIDAPDIRLKAPLNTLSRDEVVAAHVQTPVTPPDQVKPEVSGATSDALVRALAKEPGDRFQSYDEFRMALEAARSQLLVSQIKGKKEGGPGTILGWLGR